MCKQISPCVLLCVQVAAHGEGPAEAAAGPRQRAVGQQQSVGPGQNAGRDLPHLGETGSALIEGFIQETKTSKKNLKISLNSNTLFIYFLNGIDNYCYKLLLFSFILFF